MSRRWKAEAGTVGMLGPLPVRDPEDGPEGRVVYAVPGHLRHRFSERDTVQLLDEEGDAA